MKRIITSILFLSFLLFGFESFSQKKWKDVQLKNKADSVSYAIGLNIGNNMMKDSLDVHYPAITQGIKDAFEDNAIFDELEMQNIFMALQQEIQAKEQEELLAEARRNVEVAPKFKVEGELFLVENKRKEGVIETETGLQYKIIEAGSDVKPAATDKVTVHYIGRLIDGTIFDSSVDRGKQATFPLNVVIPGWTEGLQLIGEGGKIELYIPSNLAYGDKGAGEDIPGGSTLIFEIELIKVEVVE